MRLVLFGPPGAGKGTQAAFIARHLAVPHISTGDIFRENIRNGTPLGIQARQYSESGNLVPDTVTNAMVRERLSHADCSAGFLLDGYPRTTSQAGELDEMLQERGHALDLVVNLIVPDEEIMERLLKRGRADDAQATIAHRLNVYHETTKPLIGLYRDRGILCDVHGVGSIENITERILTAIQTE